MIIDFNKTDPKFSYEHDLCIVGTGAAALAMLSKLLDTNLRVLVLEAGAESVVQQNQDVYKTINKVHPFPGSMDGRFRVFGGSTTRWGGQSLPLEDHDFEYKPWVPNSGWPIAYNEVERYYPEVDKFLKLNQINYSADIYALLKKVPLKQNPGISLKFSKWSSSPNLREHFRKELIRSENITLVQNASLHSVNIAPSGDEIASVTAINFSLTKRLFRAKKYILACGGIENARILLASNEIVAAGIGNGNDLVGRYLQDHPNAHIGQLYPKNGNAQAYFNYFYDKKTRFLPRLIFRKSFLEKQQILNSSAYFSFETGDDASFSIAKDLYRKYRRGNLSKSDLKTTLQLFKNIPTLLKIVGHYAINKKVYTPNAALKLNLMTECTPNKENRIVLGDERDALGMPVAVIKWHGDELLKRTFKQSAEFLDQYFKENDLGDFVLDEWIDNDNWFDKIKDAKHHIGTTRMAKTATEGVVDADCKVFGINNLYISGSSVFPTSGHSNPTSTIIALSFRLIDHLKPHFND